MIDLHFFCAVFFLLISDQLLGFKSVPFAMSIVTRIYINLK